MASDITKARKKAIDDLFLSDVPPFGIPGASIFLATKLAKAMIDLEGSEDMSSQQQREIMNQFFGTPLDMPTRELDHRPKPKKKRAVSRYSKEFGVQLKKLKKKHPRTPVTKLMKRAHTATKKKMPKKKKVAKKGRLSKGRRTIAKSGQFRRDKLLPRYKT